MTSILFLIEKIYSNQFKCNYLGNKKFLSQFLAAFWNLHQVLSMLKNDETYSLYISKISDCKPRG